MDGQYVMPGGADASDMFAPWPLEDSRADCPDPLCDECAGSRKRQRRGAAVLAAAPTVSLPTTGLPSATRPAHSTQGPSLAPWITEATRLVWEEHNDGEESSVHVCEVEPWLYLGDVVAAGTDTLKRLRISHVLNAAGRDAARDEACAAAGAVYRQLDGQDREDYPMLTTHWEEAWAFVRTVLSVTDGRLLIHCQAGVNRSGLLATASLMMHRRLPVLEALRHVRSCRGQPVLTNAAFRRSLVQLAAEHGLLGAAPVEVESGNIDCPVDLTK